MKDLLSLTLSLFLIESLVLLLWSLVSNRLVFQGMLNLYLHSRTIRVILKSV